MEFPYRAFLCACGGRYAPPPHAWGILPYLASRYVRGRFIPTCVGNTVRFMPQAPGKSVHPHVRGEYIHGARERIAGGGSSPRAWGIRQPRSAAMRSKWFIPTCVGNTLGKRRSMVRNSVHPHVRGEYVPFTALNAFRSGSSPRAWGILPPITSSGVTLRFIPTCVGNTDGKWRPVEPGSVHPHVRGEY